MARMTSPRHKYGVTNIERISREKGITRPELARLAGVPKATLESWANKRRVPRDVYVMAKIAKVLGVSIEDIMEPEPGTETPEAPEAPEDTEGN